MIAIAASQKLFFDGEKILTRMSKAEVKVNSRFGAYVMTAARRSMRKVNKKGTPSAAGQPPKERKGFLKKGRYGVQFGWDDREKAVFIGPEIFPGLPDKNPDGTMPAALEKGGSVIVTEAQQKDGTYSRRAVAWAAVNGARKRDRKAAIKPRPFMVPALKKELPKLPGLWTNALNKV